MSMYLSKNSFVWFSANPIKLCVLVLNLLACYESKFPQLKLESKLSMEQYFEIINLLLDGNDEMQQIESTLKDKWYNQLEVIDIIAYHEFTPILDNKKVNSVILNFGGDLMREVRYAKLFYYL